MGYLAIASMLDPRNKLDCVDFYFREIYKGEAPKEIEKITSFLYDLLVEYVEKNVEVLVAKGSYSFYSEPNGPNF